MYLFIYLFIAVFTPHHFKTSKVKFTATTTRTFYSFEQSWTWCLVCSFYTHSRTLNHSSGWCCQMFSFISFKASLSTLHKQCTTNVHENHQGALGFVPDLMCLLQFWRMRTLPLWELLFSVCVVTADSVLITGDVPWHQFGTSRTSWQKFSPLVHTYCVSWACAWRYCLVFISVSGFHFGVHRNKLEQPLKTTSGMLSH